MCVARHSSISTCLQKDGSNHMYWEAHSMNQNKGWMDAYGMSMAVSWEMMRSWARGREALESGIDTQ